MYTLQRGLDILREEGPQQLLNSTMRYSLRLSGLYDYFVPCIDRSLLQQCASKTYEFSTQENLEISPVGNILSKNDFQKVNEISTKHIFNQPFVAEIKNGRVLSRTGLCSTDDYEIILDSDKSSYPPRGGRPIEIFKKKVRKKSKQADVDNIDIAVPFTSAVRPNKPRNFTNYYVWIHNYLTRLEGIHKYQESVNDDVKIVIPNNSPSWAIESLEMFGYKDNIVFWEPKEDLHINKMIIPSNRRVEILNHSSLLDHKVLPASVCKWLRKQGTEYTSVRNNNWSSKVFISRADSERRNLENRKEIMDLLRTYGFKSYELTELSFAEQVSLFSQADHVVGVHGAGLVNILFCSGCTVTEIFGGEFIPTYYVISQALGLDYQVLSGKSIKSEELPLRHQNITIDPDAVLSTVS